jgi:hypothetical protein
VLALKIEVELVGTRGFDGPCAHIGDAQNLGYGNYCTFRSALSFMNGQREIFGVNHEVARVPFF